VSNPNIGLIVYRPRRADLECRRPISQHRRSGCPRGSASINPISALPTRASMSGKDET
jgi:hypothetical protein